MSSNEHPNMHGNPMDEPFLCCHCDKEFREEDAFGVPGNDELLFCSAECAESWTENQIDAFYEHGPIDPYRSI